MRLLESEHVALAGNTAAAVVTSIVKNWLTLADS
jgi:hypothetical protein